MASITVANLYKAYPLAGGGERLALHNINLQVADGEFVCVLGPSGCGKTTLLNILAGLDSADSGSVTIEDADGSKPVTSYMFQEPRLLPWMTIHGNLKFVIDRGGKKADELIDYWLARVGLPGRGRDYPRQLSIGQRQRVAVARALLVGPDVLFMDEPFSALDELTATRMREEMLELWADLRCTVVFVTHNPMEATLLADRIVIMSKGPGRIIQNYLVSEHLPRPRDGDDPKMWEASRIAVRALRRGSQP
ncbi:MAG TPA: ABC transporter ATP-binding protein [Trueperaceae bacterium]|nr:ABC transporter ATP-binding protein [Trueperaceae bacterium]